MLDILEFIFSGFWVWLGSVVLLAVALEGLASVIWAVRRSNKEQTR